MTRAPRRRPKPKGETVPPWLQVMRSITGTTETPGETDNPKIMGMADFIADKWSGDPAMPGIESYCAEYTHDSVPWCGLTAGFCVSACDIRPPYDQKDDTGSFLWALSWSQDSGYQRLAQPRLGCLVAMEREGGGHITMFEGDNGDGTIACRGGNQSDAVNVSNYDKDTVVAYVWPRAGGPIPPAERRELSEGDTGADVVEVQRILGVPADGEFGPTTEGAVMGFQAGAGEDADGVVGEATWAALDALDARCEAGSSGLTAAEVSTIAQAAKGSALARYNWPDRGCAPMGYVVGMALSYGLALKLLEAGDSSAEVMAQANTDNEDKDALAWYADEIEDMSWDTSEDGIETLRALFGLQIGLGMRESSGRYCEGRDMSADNVTSDTAEAGLFQTSWNIRSASPEFQRLFDHYEQEPVGFLDQFREDVTPSGSDLKNYGSGDGATYQFLAKYAPAFAVLTTAVGLRTLRQHWGPINRHEVTLTSQAEELLRDVEQIISEAPPEPTPEPEPEPELPTVTIRVSSDKPVHIEVINEGQVVET